MSAARTKRSKHPLLQVERLGKYYPVRRGWFRRVEFVRAVDNVSFYIRHGETFGLVGESGSGKSTLGRTLLRLTEPTFGRILFDGKDITRMRSRDLRPRRREMQLIFQDPYASLNPRFTADEIVGEGLRAFQLAKSDRDLREKVVKWLGRVGLSPDVLDRFPHEFSGGQRQRLGIARAMAVKPKFVVCDEPVSALDVSVQAQILNLLLKLQDDLNVSYLFISHDLRVVEYVSHRMGVMYLGKIVEVGPTGKLVKHRYHPYTRALFAASPEAAEARGGRKLEVLAHGETPLGTAPPSGCVFHPRCPRAKEGRCDTDVPTLDEVVPGSHHRVACFFPHVESASPSAKDRADT